VTEQLELKGVYSSTSCPGQKSCSILGNKSSLDLAARVHATPFPAVFYLASALLPCKGDNFVSCRRPRDWRAEHGILCKVELCNHHIPQKPAPAFSHTFCTLVGGLCHIFFEVSHASVKFEALRNHKGAACAVPGIWRCWGFGGAGDFEARTTTTLTLTRNTSTHPQCIPSQPLLVSANSERPSQEPNYTPFDPLKLAIAIDRVDEVGCRLNTTRPTLYKISHLYTPLHGWLVAFVIDFLELPSQFGLAGYMPYAGCDQLQIAAKQQSCEAVYRASDAASFKRRS
jgi:hypothetical protein